jgi:hypothetical protein
VKIELADPPLIDEIDAAFKVKGKPIFFAWGDRIYNPAGVKIPPELLVHENVHAMRQKAYAGPLPLEQGIELWWRRYISDPQFRLDEELPAHVAEYWHVARNTNRRVRRIALARIAKRLSSPLYGRLIGLERAKRLINTLALELEHGRLRLDTFGGVRDGFQEVDPATLDDATLQKMQANRPGGSGG